MGPAADSKTVKRNRPGACSFEQRPFENSICLIAIRSDRFQKTIEKCLRQEPDNLPSAIGNFIRNRHLFSIRLRD